MMRPTDAELGILKVLWRRGPATVRQVHDALVAAGDREEHAYTTTLKLMQIMTEKGIVLRDDLQRSHIYRAAVTRENTQRTLLKELLEKVFEGSSGAMVLQALSAKKATKEEMEKIRKMLGEE